MREIRLALLEADVNCRPNPAQQTRGTSRRLPAGDRSDGGVAWPTPPPRTRPQAIAVPLARAISLEKSTTPAAPWAPSTTASPSATSSPHAPPVPDRQKPAPRGPPSGEP